MPSGGHTAIYAGMRMLEAGSCLKFVQRTTQRDYLQFYQGGGCRAVVLYNAIIKCGEISNKNCYLKIGE